jgi:two-component system, cell cycle sensor histidine kinase and response regulator CckA
LLYEQFDLAEAEPLSGGLRWLVPALVAAAAVSGAAVYLLLGPQIYTALFLAVPILMLVAAFFFDRRGARRVEVAPLILPDLALVGSAIGLSQDAVAMTEAGGALKSVNAAYKASFGQKPPLELGKGKQAGKAIAGLVEAARRDGEASMAEIPLANGPAAISLTRAGANGDLLLWRIVGAAAPDMLAVAAKRVSGNTGERLSAAGVMAVLVDGKGRLLAANGLFSERALSSTMVQGKAPLFADLIETSAEGAVRLLTEGSDGRPLRMISVPLEPGSGKGAATLLMFDWEEGPSLASSSNVQVLLEMLPIGLALVDRDGRFLTMNNAFRQAGGIGNAEMPSYPGDLVVKEDKAAVADAVRRNARGPSMSADLPVRLAHQPAEPVALTVAGLRGLGDAAVLLLLKDNSEEAKLKRQIAQATKMQAVGQLAGGVAHDFNNILTAIIGHCDLMLMRHTPGDTDYDDIQQIKSNSNRAAGLTRQLLAFSRQQTLRPQLLQLPDVISEVSHLLKRLLGETVQLVVKHGRDLGPVRADPGQLEQVIVNLAVNARDAMMSKGGGTLTIQTYAVRADQVADLGSEILPVADYSAVSIADTGTGIPASILSKVFEPFFTTKEVGKGTGLGLSTVYGIVKQSGGYIFADSKVGEGTRFTIYLPVHRVEEEQEAGRRTARKEAEGELWGTGTILLVEDEAMVRTVAERALTRHGYQVLTANNGEEALEIIERGDEIALLISDVVMPLMDGPTMVREARKTRPDLPILFMSGYAEEQLRKSIDIANVAFLPKPFSVQELAEAVHKALAGN